MRLTVKIIISLAWVALWISPVIVSISTNSLLLSAIGIVYGILIWEVTKEKFPKWVRLEWMKIAENSWFDPDGEE